MKHQRFQGWRTVQVFVSVVALNCASASAQLVSGDLLPEAIKDIRPAVGACRREDPLPGQAGTPVGGEVPPDLSCALPVTEFPLLLARRETLLADLRLAADFQTFRIEGALNLSASELRSKPYWRRKTVVLVGNGKAERELYSECARLKRSGYQQVRVLRGGMPMWLAQGGAVAGHTPSVPQLMRLSAAEFWLESQNPHNVVLVATEQHALQRQLSRSEVLPQTTPKTIKAALEPRRKLRPSGSASVVLAVAPGVTNEWIEKLQQSLMPVPLLVYADTPEALAHQLDAQKAVWAAQARGPKQPGCGL